MSWALPRAPFANAIITMGSAPGPDDWFSQLPSFYTNKPTILGVPVGQLTLLGPSPPRPCWFNSIVFHASVTVLPLLPRPHTLDGVGGFGGWGWGGLGAGVGLELRDFSPRKKALCLSDPEVLHGSLSKRQWACNRVQQSHKKPAKKGTRLAEIIEACTR